MWTWTVPYFGSSVTIDVFCASWAMQAYTLMSVAVMLAASFMAFRIAIDN